MNADLWAVLLDFSCSVNSWTLHITLGSGRTESPRAALRIGQFRFHPLDRLVSRHDHLCDAVARPYRVRPPPQVQQDDADLAAIPRIDGAWRVRHGDGGLQPQAATRPHLGFVTGRDLHREARGNQLRHARLQCHVLHRAQVHPGVFPGPVGVRRQFRRRVNFLDSQLHRFRYDSVLTPTKRVITVAPMPPEKSAYALARYSRSPDSIRDSIDWVRTHDSQKFLESFYFQYGHASIADLGHTVMCFEGISELAATEIEEEPLWDGQAKSSRYQDFSTSGFVTPPEFAADQAARYQAAGQALLAAYATVKRLAFACLSERLQRPADMKPDAYQRNLTARAFDVARYLLFWGVPTNVGQVVSIRTLEKQIRRLKASEYDELRQLGGEIAQACAADKPPVRPPADPPQGPAKNLPPAAPPSAEAERVALLRPSHVPADIAA